MRKLATTLVLLALACVVSVNPAAAATINVPGDYATIQEAISNASPGDVVSIGAGTFEENLYLLDGVSLQGSGVGVTIIDARSIAYGIYVEGASSPQTKILDLTVINGTANKGAGINVDVAGQCEIRRVEVAYCAAANNGGGIYVGVNGTPTIAECFIHDNSASLGGGLYLQTCYATVLHNIIYANTASSNGGGIYGGFDCSCIVNNTIDANVCSQGAGAAFGNPVSTNFEANIVSNHPAGYGIWKSGGTLSPSCNIVWSNQAGHYNGMPAPGEDQETDPMFCDYGSLDFGLDEASPAASSSCAKACGSAIYIGAKDVACGIPELEPCCFPDGSCTDLISDDCISQGGQPIADCAECVSPPKEACCFDDGSCTDLEAAECASAGGTPQGAGTACDGVSCPQPKEACCFDDGSCTNLGFAQCIDFGGTPQGDGTNCDEGYSCPQPKEACCFDDGSCSDLEAGDCLNAGGTPQGAGTACDSFVCPQPKQACCFPDGSCVDLEPLDCLEAGGLPQGAGTACDSSDCESPTATESKTWGQLKGLYR